MRSLWTRMSGLVLLLPFLATAAPAMQLQLLPEDLAKARGAQCLDHSPAGYYIREQDPKKWVIFLEGGGLCIEAIDCLARLKSHLGSSKYWDPHTPPEAPGTASLSHLNPFANWSHVYVPYCSGDTWLGKSSQGHVALLGLQMSGHLIIETLVERLLNATRIGSATDVVLSGSSAGGIGTYHHIDWLADTMAAHARSIDQASPRVVGFPVEGMFFPEKWPVLYPQFVVGNTQPDANWMSQYLHLLQDPWFTPACEEAARKEGFNRGDCFDVSKMLPYIKTPLFIGMNRFDKLLIQALGLCFECKANDKSSSWHGQFTRFYGARMNETVINLHKKLPQTGWFVPSEFHHDENFYNFFEKQEKSIAGMSLRAAFEAWYYDGRPVVLVEATCQDDGPCEFSSDCREVRGNYIDTKWGKDVTVLQTGCDLSVLYGGRTLAGHVAGDTVTVATVFGHGVTAENGDMRFTDGGKWTKQARQLASTLVV